MKYLWLAIVALSSVGHAAPEDREVTIASWQVYTRWGTDSDFEVRVTDTLNTPCAATNAGKVFTHIVTNAVNYPLLQMWQASLAYAATTGNGKVILRYDPAMCDSTRGAMLLGVKNVPPAS